MSSEKYDDSKRQAEFDSRFAEIVAQLGDQLDDPTRPDPDEPVDNTPASDGPDPATNPTTSWRWSAADEPDEPAEDPLAELPSQWRMPGPDGASILDDEEEDFVPPPPAPLPKDDLQFWAIIATLIGGPLWVFYLAIFDRYAQSLWWMLAIATCVLGVVLLVLRQPKNHDDEDDLP